MDHEMNILQFNCRGLRSKVLDLTSFLENYCTAIDIICLNETKLAKSLKNPLPGYTVACSILSSNSTHGSMILVKQGLHFKTTSSKCVQDPVTHATFEQLAIQVKNSQDGADFNVINVYNSPSMQLDWASVTSSCDNTIIVGDLNAKHKDLGNNISTPSGEVVVDALQNGNWILLNDGRPTRIDDAHRSNEMIDLHICSDDLIQNVKCFNVLESLGSDHLMTLSCFSLTSRLLTTTLPSKVNIRMYREMCHQMCADSDVLSHPLVETTSEGLQKFTLELVKTISESLSASATVSKHRTLSRETMGLIKEKRRLRRTLKQLNKQSIEYIIAKSQLNRMQKQIRKSILESDWNQQERKLQSARGRPNRNFWKAVKDIMGNGKARKHYPTLLNGSVEVKDDLSKAEVFKCSLQNNMKEPQAETDNAQKYGRKLKTTVHLDEEDITPVTVTIEELETILKGAKATAPGPDRITYKHFQWLSLSTKSLICLLFSASITSGTVPSCLKETHVHMIAKPNKDPKNPQSYRPISLTNCLSKMCETAIKNRVMQHCEDIDLFGETQSAYRQGRQSTDNLLQLTQYTSEAFQWRQMVGAVFLDVEKAFDAVWRLCLKHKLSTIELSSNYIKWILDFLSNRRVSVRVNEELSNPFTPEAGVPQGSVISPVLFLIYVAKPPALNVQVSQFADDFAVYYRSKSPKLIEKNLQAALNSLSEWCQLNRIRLNASKTKAILFHHPTRSQHAKGLTINLNGQTLENVTSVKFLGLLLSNTLNWGPHIEELIKKAGKKLMLLYHLSRRNIPSSNLLIIYKAMVRSIFTYANAAWISVTLPQVTKMQSIQNRALRICLGRERYSNVADLHRDAQIPMLNDFQLQLAKRYLNKATTNQRPWILKMLRSERCCPVIPFKTPLSLLKLPIHI